MMKHHNIISRITLWGLVLLGAAGITSCNNFLKEETYSFITPDQVGDSNEAALQWTTGVYSKLLDNMARWGYFPRILDMDCDYVSGPDWAFGSVGAGNFQNNEMIDSFWKGFYNLIFRADYARYYISGMKNIDSEFKNNCLGEMQFLKAFSYFMLTRAYGDIPLVSLQQSVAVMDKGETLSRERAPIKEVYAQIIYLLAGDDKTMGAIDLMYDNLDTGFSEGHASRGAAAALLAKVYATMASASMPAGLEITVRTGESYHYADGIKRATGVVSRTFAKNAVAGYDFDWKLCYEMAKKYARGLVDGEYGEYGLLPYDNLWKRSSANRTEHIFMLSAMSGDEKYGHSIHQWYSGQQEGGGFILSGLWIGCRWHWYQLFDSQDLRITKGVKHKIRYTEDRTYNTGVYYPGTAEYKNMAEGYVDSDGNSHSPQEPFNDGASYKFDFASTRCMAFTTKYDDVTDPTLERTDASWPFLRYADVLLILAEAECELSAGVSTEAISMLNEVRRRSNATEASTSGPGAITTKDQLRSVIIEERAKEFALEGDRRWDLLRWGIYLDAMNAIGGVNADGSRTKYDEYNIFKSREPRHLLWPLPVGEIDGNLNVDGNNPGWS